MLQQPLVGTRRNAPGYIIYRHKKEIGSTEKKLSVRYLKKIIKKDYVDPRGQNLFNDWKFFCIRRRLILI